MPEETSSPPTPSASVPEHLLKSTSEKPPKKKGKFFQRIPKELLFLPGGVILLFFALLIEIIDLIPIPILDQIIEIPLEVIFWIFFIMITKVPITNLIIPTLIERIPLISDLLPTWFLRMFI